MKTYASFFEWHEKGIKELGVVESLAEALSAAHGARLQSIREFAPDPPDCVAHNEQGELVAIEVAEVVCQLATKLTAQGEAVYRRWRSGEFAGQVAEQVLNKDQKVFHGGPYTEIIVCLFTDEPLMTHEVARSELDGLSVGPVSQVTSAYLLFSYDPKVKGYPVIQVPLRQ